MHKLIYNELIKLFKRKSTLIMIIMMVLLCLLVQWVYKMGYEESASYYGEETEQAQTVAEWKKGTFEGVSDDDPEYAGERAELKALEALEIERMDDYRVAMIEDTVRMCTDENGNCDQEKVDAAIDSEIKVLKKNGNNFAAFLEEMAAVTKDTTYDNEDLSDAITDPYQYLLDKGVTSSDDPMVEKVYQLVSYQNLLGTKGTNEDYDSTLEYIKVTKYALDHDNTDYVSKETEYGNSEVGQKKTNKMWYVLFNSTGVLTIVSILMIVIAGQIVAKEFTDGTIKFLLINPVNRQKIIASKYLTVLILAVVLTSVAFGVDILVALVMNGGKVGVSYIAYSASKKAVVVTPAALKLLSRYALKSVTTIVYATMAFALSSLFRSTAVAVGVGVACQACGSTIVLLLRTFNQDWGRYLIFANSDLTSVMAGTNNFVGQTVGFAVAVIAVHMIVFLLTAYDGFVRREV